MTFAQMRFAVRDADQRRRLGRLANSCFVALLILPLPLEAQFTYRPSGELESSGGGALRPGAGRVDETVYAPGMRFPIEEGPAYANSQIYGHGGYMGPGGGQCTAANFAYPWHDNYCEERSWTMPLCPSGVGHQGQDIRPATCEDERYWGVAAVDGTVTSIGTYSVYVTADDGTRYDYLHMEPSTLVVSVGSRVSRGDRLGKISNAFGGTSTTIHLHFNIRQSVSGVGTVYVPPYMSLVESFGELTGEGGPDWRAEFVDQSFPLSSMPFELSPGETSTGYIELRNTGRETWLPGSTLLGTSNPRDRDSAIVGPDWINAHRAASVDRAVATGETGRFNFTVRAPSTPGDYPQFFNVLQEGVAWFSDDGGPLDDQLQVRVTVTAASCPAGLGGTWECEGTDRVRCLDGTVERETCESGCADSACLGTPRDDDGDGHNTSVDCDDDDPDVHPGASDPCGDGVDANCDGLDACAGEDAGETDAGSFDAGGFDASGVDAGADVPYYREAVGGCSTSNANGIGWVTLLLLLARRRTRP